MFKNISEDNIKETMKLNEGNISQDFEKLEKMISNMSIESNSNNAKNDLLKYI